MWGVPNVDYVLEVSHDLENWATVPVTAGADGWTSITVSAPESQGACFYRYTYPVANE